MSIGISVGVLLVGAAVLVGGAVVIGAVLLLIARDGQQKG